MNQQKISFIICYNDEFYMQECRLYLSELAVPEGYEVDVVEVTGAESMTAGCNEGMRQSDAKYKIYMHQDVFITNKNFLYDLLRLFKADDKIGLIGLVGTPYMNKTGTMWNGVRLGGFYKLDEGLEKGTVRQFFPMKSGYMEMEAVDGLLMATQYDITWREDLFGKWDFYDVSQSFEFLKAGYKVVVPGQSTDWYIHDCGVINLTHYKGERQKFLEAYGSYMQARQKQTWAEYIKQVHDRITDRFHGTKEEKNRLLALVDKLAAD